MMTRNEQTAILGLLASRKVLATVTAAVDGPRLTRYTLAIPDEVPVGRVTRLQADLSALFGLPVRVVAPLGGEPGIVVEVPRLQPKPVPLVDLLPLVNQPLQLAIGRDMRGEPLIRDLKAAPHLLVAGATGSGKSVSLNCILLSLLRHGPETVRLAMIDLKRVELTTYAGLPHLVRPVATTRREAVQLLAMVAKRIEVRYKLLESHGLRQWDELRAIMPGRAYLVLVIDELADLLADEPDTQALLVRIAQLGRAAGVHIVAAAQRADSRILTGVLKGQFPSRLAFALVSATDSRVCLDVKGAESLLGKGDGLLREPAGLSRIQGAMYAQNDIEAVLRRFAGQVPNYWQLPSSAPPARPYVANLPVLTLPPVAPLPWYATARGRLCSLWSVYLTMFLILAAICGSCIAQSFGGN